MRSAVCGLAAVGVAATVACGSEMETVPGPAITAVEYVQNPNSPLSGTVEVVTDRPALVDVNVTAADHEVGDVPARGELAGERVVPVLRLRAETRYELVVTARTSDGEVSDEQTLEVTTDPLPDDVPPIEVGVPLPDRVSPGITLFPVFRWNPGKDDEWGLILGVDEAGRVVWYYRHDHSIEDVSRLPNGNLAFTEDPDAITEIDMMGNVVGEITAEGIGADSLHHEVNPIEGGTLLALATEMKEVEYPDGEGGTVTHNVVGDVALELEPDGTIVNEWSMFDVLDPQRTRPGFDAGFWNPTYPDAEGGTKDWTHGNSVIHDPRDDSLILSLRHQDWVIKVDRASGDLVWALGEEGDFTMEGGGEWQFHQHAPEIQENGNLLVYDNGNARSTLADGDTPYTRTVEFDVDAGGGAVTQAWEYRNPEGLYAPFVGDADRTANGNVLVTDGGLVVDPSAPIADPDNLKYARIVEVTHESDPETVLELTIRDTGSEPVGYTVYRSERVPTLYPPDGGE